MFSPSQCARLLLGLAGLAGAVGCDTGAATYAVVDDGYPAPAGDGGTGPQDVIYRAWWSVTYFAAPLAAGAESDANRVIPATDYAYAVLAPGWDPTSGVPPTRLLPMRTKATLTVARGDTLHVVFSDATATGNCAAAQPLTQDEADLITKSIFPDEFAGATYDAATCTVTTSAGAEADADAGR